MTKRITLDCRGLACPGPVLKTMEALESSPAGVAPEALASTGADQGARETVTRLLNGKGYSVSAEAGPDAVVLTATRTGASAPAGEACAAAVFQALGTDKITVFITADGIGTGSDELGGKLMLNFLATLPELGQGLWRVVLVNGGVRLACEGHPCLEKLQALAATGVSILVCGTCLNFFGLTEQKRAGETTNMLDVVTSLGLAGKVIQV